MQIFVSVHSCEFIIPSTRIFDQAGGQCQQGGVLAINPTSTQTPAQFKQNAANSPVAPMTNSTDSTATPTALSSSSESFGSAGGGSNGAIGLKGSIGGLIVIGITPLVVVLLP
jgi:hypothetical protein